MAQTAPTAIITGASSGIGRQISIDLAKDGKYKLCLIARNVSNLKETKRLCVEQNGHVEILIAPCDFNDINSVKDVFKKVCNEHGPVSVLINNAGMAGAPLSKSGSEKNLKHTDMVINVNLKADMIATQLCLPFIIESAKQQRGPCAIIHIGSVLGTDFGVGLMPTLAAYNVSKHGQRVFNECLFERVRKYGIKCCCIMPGFVRTAMTTDLPGFNAEDFMSAKDVSRAVQYVLNSSKDACPTDIVIRSQRSTL